MKKSRIEWTQRTWNPVTGCTKVSAGCANCYAEAMSRRLCAMGLEKYGNGFEVTLHRGALREPLTWRASSTIFVCSMSDLFHEKVPDSFIDQILTVIAATPWHNYQILTKRADRMARYFVGREVPRNVWLGVTMDGKAAKGRIDSLRSLNASVKFLSCEPLIEDLGVLDLSGIDWIIVGGESGPGARPMREEWALAIKEQADSQGCAFFFKQWGAWGSDGVKRSKKENGYLLEGRIFQAMPK